MRPSNYDWLVPGIRVLIYTNKGVHVGNFVLRKKEPQLSATKFHLYDKTDIPWSVGLMRHHFYALPQDLSILNNNKRWI